MSEIMRRIPMKRTGEPTEILDWRSISPRRRPRCHRAIARYGWGLDRMLTDCAAGARRDSAAAARTALTFPSYAR